jgi:DNA modification methylase
MDNMKYETNRKFNVIYSDYIYQNLRFDWIDKYWDMLAPNSIFIAQTDDSSMAQVKLKLDSMPNSIWINTCIQVQEWGGTSKRFFSRKHDYIFIYANGKDYKFYPERVQVEKSTRNTAFDKKGTGMKTPCDVFYDIPNFSTMANERVKNPETGKNQQWQKSQAVLNRVLITTTDEGDWIMENFGGVFSTCLWAKNNNRNAVGIEIDTLIFAMGYENVEKNGKNGEGEILSQLKLPIDK